jgi:hypothetical protein
MLACLALATLVSVVAEDQIAPSPLRGPYASDQAQLAAAEAASAAFAHSAEAALLRQQVPQLDDLLRAAPAGLVADLSAAMAQDIAPRDPHAVLAARLGGPRDAAGSQAWEVGAGGTLHVFWSLDAPGIRRLHEQLVAVVSAHPKLVIVDTHLLPISVWLLEIKRLEEVKNHLVGRGLQLATPAAAASADDDSAQPEHGLPERALLDVATEPWMGFSQMSHHRRQGGYLLVEDVSSARVFGIEAVPCFVYLSPRGLVHRLAGLPDAAGPGLVSWVNRILAWEIEHDAALRAQQERLR